MDKSRWLLKEAADEILKEAGILQGFKELGSRIWHGAKEGVRSWKLDRVFNKHEASLRKLYQELKNSGYDLGNLSEDDFVKMSAEHLGRVLSPEAEKAVAEAKEKAAGTWDKAAGWMKEHPAGTAAIGVGAGLGGGFAAHKIFDGNNNQ